MRRCLAVAAIAIFMQAISGLFSFVQAQGQPVTFSTLGDIPYGSAEYAILRQYVADHNRYSPSAFIIHVGDILVHSCEEYKYADVANIMKGFAVPAYFVVGDNEYNDCDNPVAALALWKKYFLNFQNNFCGAPSPENQSVRPENLAFVMNGVLFVGINLVGPPVHDQKEWNTRMQNDADWVSQQFQAKRSQVRAAVIFAQTGDRTSTGFFISQFRPAAAAFGKPVLYIHGDLHTYKFDQPWAEKNITRLEVPKGNLEPPLEVTISMNTDPPQGMGMYTVKRNPWTGALPYNMPPCVNAGSDQMIQIPATATLTGGATDDGDPNGALTTTWSQVSGPGAVTFGNANALTTTANFDAPGTYVLRLTANDGELQKSDEVTVVAQGGSPTLSINDVNINEGDSGTSDAVFTVSLSNANGQTVTVDYQIIDGTATPGDDYVANPSSGTLTFNGATTQTITATINGDANDEPPNETFFVNLSNATNATIVDHQGVGTIINDDGPSLPAAPGNLSGAATGASTIVIAWNDNSADEDGFKIERKIGGLFNQIGLVGADVTSYTDIGLSAGTMYVYRLRAYNAAGNSAYSNEAAATTSSSVSPAFSISDVSINEGNSGSGDVLFAVTLANPNGQPSTVDYQIVDGTATQGNDYSVAGSAGTITFLNGATTQNITVTIHGDVINEPDETFSINLLNAANATIADNHGAGTIINDDTTLPLTAPDNLTASATSSATISLAWRDNSPDEEGFKIERMLSGGSFSEVATTGGTVNFYNDAGLSAGTMYVYRVRAFRATENSDYSNQISATTASVNAGPAFSISDVSITEGHAGTVEVLVAVSLANPNGQSSTIDFQIVEGTAARGEDYSIISDAGTMTFFNGGATTQRIRVTIHGDAVNEPDETVLVNLSNAPNATIADHQGVVTILNDDGTVMPPNAPDNLTASAPGTTTASLAWSDNSSDEDGFKIERKISGGNFSEIGTTGSNVNSFNDTGLNACTTYIYRIRAFKGAVHSSYSNEASSATTGCESGPALAIADVSASEGNSGTTDVVVAITLTNPNSQTVTVDYQVVDGSATGGSDYTVISTSGTMTFFNGGATTQRLRVTIIGDAANEADETFLVHLSNATNATITDDQGVGTIINDDGTVTPPNAPGNLTASATGTTTASLAWTDNSSDEDGFKIERKIDGGSFTEIATIGHNANSFNDTELSAGATYVYRVRAFKAALTSSYSNEASATTSSIGGGGSGNLALNQLAAASSTNPTALKPATNTVDGNALTFWRSASVPTSNPTAWLRVDLGSPQTVGRVVVKWKDAYHAKSYEIQVANDALNWTTVYSTIAGSKAAQNLTFSPTMARYVQIYMTKNNKGSYRIAEFEVYSGANAALGKQNESTAAALPNEFVLQQNYPNPFNPSTKISFNLPQAAQVTIKVYTINGVEVATVADDDYAAGTHAVIFKSKNLPSGTYFYVMQAGGVRQVRRLLLVK